MQPAEKIRARKIRRMRKLLLRARRPARQETTISDARRSPSATPHCRTDGGGRNSMLLLALQSAALLVAAPAQDLQAVLRHLDSVAAAWAPAPSRDLTRVAFLTTLFGTRQAASMALEGSYPTQLTDEPAGVLAIAWVPPDAQWLVATVSREGRERLLLLGDDGAAPVPIDAAPGDQRLGGFSRDGKRMFYAVVDGARVSLRNFGFETRKSVEVAPPPPAAGVKPAKDSLPLED